MHIFSCLCVSVLCLVATAFIPHPVARFGGQAGDSITHTDMVQLGLIRSLARFFLNTAGANKNNIDVNKLSDQHTIDELYEIVHPDWNSERIKVYSYPLKSVIDRIQMKDALVDLDPKTKNLPSAHFDAESFLLSNQRIMELRKKVIEDANNPEKDLHHARGRLGELLHTLQDFYSHSNWIEMGNKDINDRIGLQEDIGSIAGPDQATCTSDGCTKVQSKCNLLNKLILKKCPMIYYDCKNNLLDSINQQRLLTSGYVSNQFNANEEPILKPTNVEKCSHGSVLDSTSHHSPIGGINKDSMTPVYSPHYHLHFDAAKLSIDATERFINDIRKDIGDGNFDRLLAINPTEAQIEKASQHIIERKQFRFLTSTLSIGLSTADLNFQKTVKQRAQQILSTLFGISDPNAPTLDLSDVGVSESDVNIHAAPLLTEGSKTVKKRRFRY